MANGAGRKPLEELSLLGGALHWLGRRSGFVRDVLGASPWIVVESLADLSRA